MGFVERKSRSALPRPVFTWVKEKRGEPNVHVHGAGGRGERGLAGKWKMLSITAASLRKGLKSDLTQEFLPLEK